MLRTLESGHLGSSPSPSFYHAPLGPLTQCPQPQFYHLYSGENNRAVVSKGVNTGLEQGTAQSQHLRNATSCCFLFIIQNPNIKGVSTPNNEELGCQDVSILVLESTLDNNMKRFDSAL